MIFFYYLDSGLESEFIQEGLIGSDKAPTVEESVYQDDTKNGHLGNLFFFYFDEVCFITFNFSSFNLFFILFYIIADADDRRKEEDG